MGTILLFAFKNLLRLRVTIHDTCDGGDAILWKMLAFISSQTVSNATSTCCAKATGTFVSYISYDVRYVLTPNS